MATAMAGREPDRAPVTRQLALGDYFLNAGRPPTEIWHGTPEFGQAPIDLQQRYGPTASSSICPGATRIGVAT